jgi:hypothetical protein
MARKAALGIFPHTSWAALVVIGGPLNAPVLVDRRRIELNDGSTPTQAYHAAEGSTEKAAAALVKKCAATMQRGAIAGLREALAAARDAGYSVGAASIVADVKTLPPLASILRSHMLLHAAEGDMSREALSEAATSNGLAVHYMSPKGTRDPALVEVVVSLGRDAGPPWRKDHKEASLGALLALGA